MKIAAICWSIGLLFVLPLCAQVAAPIGKEQSVELNRLEVTEELSESLANDLLDLSIAARDRDLEQIANFFPDTLSAAPFPSQATATRSEVKWISIHGWTAPGNSL